MKVRKGPASVTETGCGPLMKIQRYPSDPLGWLREPFSVICRPTRPICSSPASALSRRGVIRRDDARLGPVLGREDHRVVPDALASDRLLGGGGMPPESRLAARSCACAIGERAGARNANARLARSGIRPLGFAVTDSPDMSILPADDVAIAIIPPVYSTPLPIGTDAASPSAIPTRPARHRPRVADREP